MALKKKPGIGSIRKKPTPKSCCGAIRGHKPDCKTLAVSDNEADAGAADVLDETTAVAESSLSLTDHVVASLRGIEEAVVRLAESLDTIKVILGSRANEERVSPAPRARPVKEKPAPEAEVEAPKEKPEPAKEKPAPKAPPPAAPERPDMDEVRKIFLAFASRKGRDTALALLAKFGAAKLGEVPEDKIPALFKMLQAGG